MPPEYQVYYMIRSHLKNKTDDKGTLSFPQVKRACARCFGIGNPSGKIPDKPE